MGNLKTDFQRHIDESFPELKNSRSVLAVSGGMDSMALCSLLLDSGVDFSVAHCNFQLRGADSLEDERFVIRKAGELGLECHTRRFETSQYAEENRLSVQMAARALRYAWFDEILDQTGSSLLLTAHHADDNLETFLINLSRGSGIRGLTGIPERTGRIIRPLLPFSRQDIEEFASESHLEWREDQSNAEDKYLRNRIRNQLIPVIKQTFPSFLESFRLSLSHLKETRHLAEDRLREAWLGTTSSENGITRIEIEKLRSFGNLKACLFGLLRDYGFTQWNDIEELLSAQPGKMIFSASHRLLKDRKHLLLQQLDALPVDREALLIRQGQEQVDLGDSLLRISEIRPKESPEGKGARRRGKHLAILNSESLAFPLLVRKWEKGDYFYPQGMKGSKKLSKYLKDEKLSVPEKENIWLLCSQNKVAWVIGHRVDERFALKEENENGLLFELIQK